MSNFTCITIVSYDTFRSKVWAFGMMQYGHKHLRNVPGLNFYRLMGSGSGEGYSPIPDWGTYALITTWNDQSQAEEFLKSNSLIVLYQRHGTKMVHYKMKPIRTHGKWSGMNPFEGEYAKPSHGDNICVLTRATIRWSKLRSFWKYVPTAEKPFLNNSDMLFSKGIGEVPFLQMVTFSIWDNNEAINQAAYKSKEHGSVVKMARDLRWFREELFARFVLVDGPTT